jgi:hypothetical protein
LFEQDDALAPRRGDCCGRHACRACAYDNDISGLVALDRLAQATVLVRRPLSAFFQDTHHAASRGASANGQKYSSVPCSVNLI